MEPLPATATKQKPGRPRGTLRALCEGAILVVMAQLLGYLKLWEMPWGGSICLSMLPIFLFAVRWGIRNGLMAGLVLGILQFMYDGGFALGWPSILGDYLLAFTVLGVAGLFRQKKGGIFWGTALGGAARFLVHYVTGATIWASLMPDTFFGMTMTNPWFYSFLYNGFYMVINTALCLVVFSALYAPMRKYLSGTNLQS